METPMQVPRAADLLDAWDAGAHASSAQRALLLAQIVCEESIEELAAMPLGWIAAQLLRVRAALVGPTLVCLVDCRRCGTGVESRIDVEELIVNAGGEAPAEKGALHHVRADGVDVEFRLPTCRDLLALHGDAQEASGALACAVIARALQNSETLLPADVPASVRAPLERAILEVDPLARIDLGIVCPACGVSWTEPLHVSEFVWTEVSDLAQRLIGEVARLAGAFGWREHDILEMSSHRRRQYLELLSS